MTRFELATFSLASTFLGSCCRVLAQKVMIRQASMAVINSDA